jgi:inner membrane protein
MTATIRRTGPILAVLVVVAVDAIFRRVDPPLVVAAVLDESAHLMTALLLLGALMPHPRREWLVSVVVGASLIDVDHIPMEFDWDYFTRGTDRPYSHSLLTIVAAALIVPLIGAAPTAIGRGVAFGLATHFLRDMATGGVPLLWPITKESVTIGYTPYIVLLVAAAVIVILRGARSDARRQIPLREPPPA